MWQIKNCKPPLPSIEKSGIGYTAAPGATNSTTGLCIPDVCVCGCVCSFALDAILNMVNNIAANVLGGKPELEGGTETGGTHPSYT